MPALTLGERLKQINQKTEAETKAEKLREEAEANAAAREKLNKVTQFFDHLKSAAEASILAGKAPKPVLLGKLSTPFSEAGSILETFRASGNEGELVRRIKAGPYEHLYQEFENWLQANSLTVKITYTWDSGGMDSWFIFEVQPQ